MTIEVERLEELGAWHACERFQRDVIGDPASAAICRVPMLRAIRDSGGVLLGAWDTSAPERQLVGVIVDMAGTHQRFSALFSLFVGVDEGARNTGIGYQLRSAEREIARELGIDVIRGWIDPLRSDESHFALNKLGAVGAGYERNVFGELHDKRNEGLASDRVGVEWWVRSPRCESILDEGRIAPHYRLGLHQMTVVTRTTLAPSGQRSLVETRPIPVGQHLLIEIPVRLDELRDADGDSARRWRLATRELIELLFSKGYLLVGLVHEAGRSFQLFEAASLGEVLGRG